MSSLGPATVARSAGDCRCAWPWAGLYAFAGHVEPITVIGLAGDDEVRIILEDGTFRTVPQHRVTLLDRRDVA